MVCQLQSQIIQSIGLHFALPCHGQLGSNPPQHAQISPYYVRQGYPPLGMPFSILVQMSPASNHISSMVVKILN